MSAEGKLVEDYGLLGAIFAINKRFNKAIDEEAKRKFGDVLIAVTRFDDDGAEHELEVECQMDRETVVESWIASDKGQFKAGTSIELTPEEKQTAGDLYYEQVSEQNAERRYDNDL